MGHGTTGIWGKEEARTMIEILLGNHIATQINRVTKRRIGRMLRAHLAMMAEVSKKAEWKKRKEIKIEEESQVIYVAKEDITRGKMVALMRTNEEMMYKNIRSWLESPDKIIRS